MTKIFFSGPTLAAEEIGKISDGICLPPAARGDVYRAALTGPRVIGIIDGYFQGALSVWHKEILWAMSQGVYVFGCSSMGALRAAELHPYGMRGVGRIFEAYCDGSLEDDDEVALLHGPEETGFVPLSEPMVSIRATLDLAVDDGIIDAEFGAALCQRAKEMFYHERSWPAVLAISDGCTDPRLKALKDWLPEGRIDAKRDDALEMLQEIEAFVSSDPAPMEVDYAFEWTHLWDGVTRDVVDDDGTAAAGEDGVTVSDILDELRLEPDAFGRVRREALLRLLALKESHARNRAPEARQVRERLTAFRLSEGLLTRDAFESWLEENRMDAQAFERLVEDDFRIDLLLEEAGDELNAHMVAALRTSSEFAALRERAEAKRAKLGPRNELADAHPASGISHLQLVAWYFEFRLGRNIPEDLERYLVHLGLSSREEFYVLLAREYENSQ